MKTFKSNMKIYSLRTKESNIKNVKISSSESASDFMREFYYDDIERTCYGGF